MNIIFQQIPGQTFILVPLGELPHLLSHEQKLLARMGHHKSIGGSQIGKFRFKCLARHLACYRSLAMHHFIMG